jgi:N-acetylglucosaminyl-diphospho-decaprenol L-rhamnosyltransferase
VNESETPVRGPSRISGPGHSPREVPSCRVAGIVLNYCTADLALQAAASAQADLDPSQDVVVIVDNRSPDGSADRIEAALNERSWPNVRLVRSPSNGGFAAGNNVGIRSVDAEAYLLLNSDTIMRPGATGALWDAAQSDEAIGVASPLLCWEDGEPQISCFRPLSPMSELIRGAQTSVVTKLLSNWDVPLGVQTRRVDVDWTSFAAVLIKRRVFETVGLLDEGFFMYFEDTDYCRLVREAGFRIVNEPAARVVHLRGKSSPVKEATRLKKRRPPYYYAARTRYFRRAFGPAGPWMANGLWTVGLAVAASRTLLQGKESPLVQGEFFDNWRGILGSDDISAKGLSG